MYSIVLMAAMTGTPAAPEFGGLFRDRFGGCYGCSGSAQYSCYGGCCGSSGYSSCSGCSGCSGCCGGGLFSGFGTRIRRLFEPGGCCGSHSYGCAGSAFSCYGSSAYSCFGGPVTYDPQPVYPGYPGYPGTYPAPVPPPPGIPYAPPEAAPPGGLTGVRPAGFAATPVSGGPSVQQVGRATVVIRLPADARLYADDAPLRMTGPERKFVTPDLPAGQEFTYRFRAEYDRDGEVISVTRKVAVRAGATLGVEFSDLTAAKPGAAQPGTGGSAVVAAPVSNPKPDAAPSARPAGESPAVSIPAPTPTGPAAPGAPATDRATITVTLPPGAALYVDGRRSPATDTVRQFTTPPLPAGQEFAYVMKAEIVRDGRPETVTQKVPFKAGERVTVDFSNLGR